MDNAFSPSVDENHVVTGAYDEENYEGAETSYSNQADILPYDPLTAPETAPSAEGALPNSLRDRIGLTKLYLLSDTSVRQTKRKLADRVDGDDEKAIGTESMAVTVDVNKEMEMEMDTDEDSQSTHRSNALLLHGPPIAHLPTARLFVYARHFRAEPLGLEWVDDTTCVLVFASRARARAAFSLLRRPERTVSSNGPIGHEDSNGINNGSNEFVVARPVPLDVWPPEERIGASLGLDGSTPGRGNTTVARDSAKDLRGTIHMRWAVAEDVKKKGARLESQFYRRHGSMAGKEAYGGEDLPPVEKRRRRLAQEQRGNETEMTKAQLDAELDYFLAEDENADDGHLIPDHEKAGVEELEASPSSRGRRKPMSKMRSDYIAEDGRTVLMDAGVDVATSWNHRLSPPLSADLASRITAPLPRRVRTRRHGQQAAARSKVEENGNWSKDLASRMKLSGLGTEQVDEKMGEDGWSPSSDLTGTSMDSSGRTPGGGKGRGRGRGRGGRSRRSGGNRGAETMPSLKELDEDLEAFWKEIS